MPYFLEEPFLNLRNGLLDLRTGQLLKHNPEVITTSQLPDPLGSRGRNAQRGSGCSIQRYRARSCGSRT